MDKSKDKTKTKMFQDALIDSEDFLKNIIQKFCQDILEEEMEKHLGAKKYERSISRSGHRNGYKPGTLRTRAGTLNLLVPQDREGNFSTELFNRYQRSEKALVLTLMEMYIKGVSTRKVSDITEKLCGISFSSTTISALTSKLDGEIKRRIAIVRIFPNPLSAARLITSICMEQNEEWISERKYLNMVT